MGGGRLSWLQERRRRILRINSRKAEVVDGLSGLGCRDSPCNPPAVVACFDRPLPGPGSSSSRHTTKGYTGRPNSRVPPGNAWGWGWGWVGVAGILGGVVVAGILGEVVVAGILGDRVVFVAGVSERAETVGVLEADWLFEVGVAGQEWEGQAMREALRVGAGAGAGAGAVSIRGTQLAVAGSWRTC